MFGYFEDNMMVTHPIVFLCGPFYKNEEDDRRNILLDFFNEKFDRRVISLIIDDFIISKNIKDSSINIKLLEEIFAIISSKTYIFLDTMSAASELGLFASHSAANKIHVLLPTTSDILENRVGYFVKDIVLGQNYKRIDLDYYRPKIIKKAIATNYVVEHYGFINNKVPKEITDKIERDPGFDFIDKEIIISYSSTEIPHDFAVFNISITKDKLKTAVSIKTLFYIIASLVYEKYNRTELKDKDIDKIKSEFIDELYVNLRKAIALSFSVINFQKLYNYEDVYVIANSQENTKTLIKHILKFIILYHENDPRNGTKFITNKDKIITIFKRDLKKIPYEIFDLNDSLIDLIYHIGENYDTYFEEFEIKKYGKKRVLCRYKKDEFGNKARELHNSLLYFIKNIVSLSDSSYAYQEGKSIVSCVKQHINSKGFIKLDISKFFNNIDIDLLIDDVINALDIDIIFMKHIRTIIKSCTYKDKLPLGFTISPILTEIYMKSFDEGMLELSQRYGYIYTRYADDIMLSSNEVINIEKNDEIISQIEKMLTKRKLSLNKTKCRFINISKESHHVKYLGINILHGVEENTISIGKKYRNTVAKEFLRFLGLPKDTEDEKKTRFYISRIIAGKISFIKQVEGEDGYNKLIERIRTSTQGKVNITTDKIYFETFEE